VAAAISLEWHSPVHARHLLQAAFTAPEHRAGQPRPGHNGAACILSETSMLSVLSVLPVLTMLSETSMLSVLSVLPVLTMLSETSMLSVLSVLPVLSMLSVSSMLSVLNVVVCGAGVCIGCGMNGVTLTGEAARLVASGRVRGLSPYFVPSILSNAAAGELRCHSSP
jgi:hypothetical protein